MKILVLKVCLLFVLGICLSEGILVSNYFEQRCSPQEGFVTANFKRWTTMPLYYPLMSSLHILRFSQILFKQTDLSFLSVADILNSCVSVTVGFVNRTETISAYCGKTQTMQNIIIAPNVTLWNKTFPEGLGGVFRISLSDNKSWLIVNGCWEDGQRSFAVLSRFPTLDPCDLEVIVTHLKAIGFQEKFFTRLNYNSVACSCPSQKRVE